MVNPLRNLLQKHHCLAAWACLLSLSAAADAYPVNYLSAQLGASVATESRLSGKGRPSDLLSDGPVSKGRISFAGIPQRRMFTVDLGSVRAFDRVEVSVSGATGALTINASRQGADGPFTNVFARDDLGAFQVLRLPKTTARWVWFDFGEGSGGLGVGALRLYQGYEHPGLVEVTELLYQQIQRGLPGLEKFDAAAAKRDWKTACRELRAYYAGRFGPKDKPNPRYDVSRAQDYADGKLDYAGIIHHQTVPIDWAYMRNNDWYEHRNFLNRGAILGVPLEAYWNTGDPKWLAQFRAVFYDWVDANPKPAVMSGADYPTWRTLDSAARLGWLSSRFGKLSVLQGADDELWANYLFSIWEHTDYLKNDNFTGGNWLAHSSAAVMGSATDYPEFKDRTVWLGYGKTAFERNVLRDIHPDGKEMEDAPGYVSFAYNAMLATLQDLEKAGLTVEPEARRRMDRVQDWLGAVTQPNGETPMIGDWGGGEAYPLHKSMLYFQREDIRYILTRGQQGVKPAFGSIHFPQGGWSIMRSAYGEKPYENARHLTFHTSQGAHGHRDINAVTAYAYGRELLIDPGIRSYESTDLERYPTVPYHNTVCVDGQSYKAGAGRTEKWVSNDGIDYVLGSHSNYAGLVHRRGVLFVKPEYWIVLDEVSGEGRHTYDQNWHFALDAAIAEDPVSKAVHTGYASGGNLLIVPAEPVAIESGPTEFYLATKRMAADAQGEALAKGWRYTRSGPPPQVFQVVLYPYVGPDAPPLSVAPVTVVDADPREVTALAVRNKDVTDYVLVSRTGVRKMNVPCAELTVEAEIAVFRTRNGKVESVRGERVTGWSGW
jgi:hypothetical protein